MTFGKQNIVTTLNLNSNWDFTYQPGFNDYLKPDLPDYSSFTAVMPVPGYWDDNLDKLRHQSWWSSARFNPNQFPIKYPMGDQPPDGELPFLLGIGWYKKVIKIPKDKSATLHIGGVAQESWVWLDGKFLHHHKGHCTPFEITLPDAKDQSFTPSKELIIAIANTKTDRLGCAIRGFKGRSGGIYGDIFLRLHGDISIKDQHIYPDVDMKKLNWQVALNGNQEAYEDLQIHWEILDRSTKKIIAQNKQQVINNNVKWTTSTLGLEPWSDTNPALYKIQLTLYQGETILDIKGQNFGLRRLAADGCKLKLNGKPIYLRGITEHAYYPSSCTPPTDKQFYLRCLRIWKNLGFNWLRFHTWVPPKQYLEAADEIGMLIQIEPPKGFDDNEWEDILRWCKRHPSVVIYCAGNEELLDEKKISYLKSIADTLRKQVPDSLFNPQEALRGVEYCWDKSDFGSDYCQDPYPRNAKRLEQLKSLSDLFGQYSWGLLSYKSLENDWQLIDKRLEEYKLPCLSHEISIIGNYLNLGLRYLYKNTRISTDMFDALEENLEKESLLNRASKYYYNSCKWASLIRKHTLERARLSRRLAGFDFLGGVDTHWHRTGYPCGILNEFFQLKPGDCTEDYYRLNGPTVVLADISNQRNYQSEQKFKTSVHISHFGEGDLKQASTYWKLKDQDGYILKQGNLTPFDIAAGMVIKLGDISFSIPKVEATQKLSLDVNVESNQRIFNNRWNIWAFPKNNSFLNSTTIDKREAHWTRKYQPAKESDSIKLLDSLDSKTIKWLENGGRGALLGAGGLPTLPTSFQPSVAGRANGNLATVIQEHPVTNAIAHEGFADWSYYQLLENAEAINFTAAKLPFEPVIEIVSSFKMIIKQAALFELTIGKGRLVVCSLNLKQEDPAAHTILESIIFYLNNPGIWQPAPQVAPKQIIKALNKTNTRTGNVNTDAGFDRRGQLETPPK